jgi:2-polyprenyl-3-methyl-5-hydroxy-6-metoxy-1,4-benzoquinol methylase
MISVFRFGWLDYFKKKNFLIKTSQLFFGILFLHSRQVAYYLFHIMPFSENDKVLDIGCGDGSFANWIAYKSKASVTGIDRLEQRLNNARLTSERYSLHCEYQLEDINSVEFHVNKFSKILLIDVLEHIEKPQEILKKCSGWIIKNGLLFISVPQKNQKRWWLNKQQDFFNYGEDNHKFIGFDSQEIIKWIEENNFVVIQKKEAFYFFYQICWELLEPVRKIKPNLYRFLVPFFYPFLILDRMISLGRGNCILFVAKKNEK